TGCPAARAVGEVVEAGRPGPERVRLRTRAVDDAVAGSDLVRLPVLPGQAASSQEEEDLLVGSLDVRRRRPVLRLELDAAHACADRARGDAEVAPGAADVTGRPHERVDLVPVRQAHRN